MSENADPPAEVAHPVPEIVQQVRTLAKVKTREQVARKLGLPVALFNTHYGDEYQEGQDEAETGLMTKLLAQGMAGNANAAWKWFSRKGLTVAQRVELTGKNGRPVEFVDLSRLSDEQLEQYGRLAATVEGLDPDAIVIEPIKP